MTRESYVTVAYFEKRWVEVILPYVPKEDIDEDGYVRLFKFTPEDGQDLLELQERRELTEEYAKIDVKIEEIIDPFSLTDRQLKNLAKMNDIPLGWLTKNMNVSLPKGVEKDKKRKCFPLTRRQFRRLFLDELKKINSTYALIAEILWFLNWNIRKEIGRYVALEELLRLQVQNVALDNVGYLIHLSRMNSRTLHYLPKYLWRRLCAQITPASFFVFSNKNGGPLLSGQVDRCFKKAGKKAEILGSVTSLSLRPFAKKKEAKKGTSNRPIKNFPFALREVSIDEWELIKKKFPFLLKRVGRPSKYDQRAILNAILYHKREGCPIRKLSYPPGRAVHSQYVRWLNSGFFDQFLTMWEKIDEK